jgi:diguanylate cyclase (GGDEF)-like protein
MRLAYRSMLPLLLVGSVLLFVIYASLGSAKTFADWKWMDIVGEGGTTLLSGFWALLIAGSRPRGRVTALLAGGLAAIMLGSWADCLDEFFAIPKDQYWDNWLEAIFTPGGMLVVTFGLYYWREEQHALNEHMQKRERVFRDHRGFDRVTQLADAAYLRRQLSLEEARPGALVLLDVNRFHAVNREYGQVEGDCLLQALGHLLLLNLRPDDLLCRYAGDRFAIFLPGASAADAGRIAWQLQQAVRSLAHYTRDGCACVRVSVRVASGAVTDDVGRLLDDLNAVLELSADLTEAVAVGV